MEVVADYFSNNWPKTVIYHSLNVTYFAYYIVLYHSFSISHIWGVFEEFMNKSDDSSVVM